MSSPDAPCETTCGNNTLDSCSYAIEEPERCSTLGHTTELCDGSDFTTTCAAFNYTGGQLECVYCFSLAYTGCVACAANALTCRPLYAAPVLHSTSVEAVAAFGSEIALVARDNGSASFVIVDLAGSGVTTISSPITDAALTAVSDGWLAAGDSQLVHLDGSAHLASVDVGSSFTSAALAFGPGSDAIVAWSVGDGQLWSAIATVEGAIAIAPFVVTTGAGSANVAATTDGTSFFVATSGTLARIDSNGTVLSVDSTFPIGDSIAVSWSGTSGVFGAWSGTSGTLLTFDSTGAPVGTAVPFVEAVSTFSLYDAGASNGLVAVQAVDPVPELLTAGNSPDTPSTEYGSNVYRLQVASVAGGASMPVDIGASYGLPVLAGYGSAVAVGWIGAGQYQLEIVNPN